MASYDKNGIRILRNEKVVRAAFSKVTLKEEGIDNDLLQVKVKAAVKAARAMRVAQEAEEREAAKEANLTASKKLLSFVRGVFFNSPSEIEEIEEELGIDVGSPSSIREEKDGIERAVEILTSLGEYKTLEMEKFEEEHGTDIFKYHGIPEIVAVGAKKAFEHCYIDDDKSEETHANISKFIGIIARERGRKRAAKSLKLSRPELFRHYNVDPLAFKYVEVEMLKRGINPKEAWFAGYDKGIRPLEVSRAWYASGCNATRKFRYFVDKYLDFYLENGNTTNFETTIPRKSESLKGFLGRDKVYAIMRKYKLHYIDYNSAENDVVLNVSDRKRLERLKNDSSIYYALKYCVVKTDIKKGGHVSFREGCHIPEYLVSEIDWGKLSEWTRLPRRERASSLPFDLAWQTLFNRPCPIGLEDEKVNPTHLLDKVTQRTFRQLMSIVKSESESQYALAANTKAAYNLSIVFRDIQTTKRWISRVGDGALSALSIHDANVPAIDFVNLVNKAGWVKLLNQFPDLRWMTSNFARFEKEFSRLPVGKKEFVVYSTSLKFGGVDDIEVANIAAKCNVSQDRFEEYQEFFKKHTGKKASMLPKVEVGEGAYTFTKLDDFDKTGPFLGLMTDCCQHFGDAGRSCAKAGWKHSESGFYVVYKGDRIVAQSWAWRGTDGALCFDSIEGLGEANIKVIGDLYKRAAEMLLGRLGITRVTVGNTSYGMTGDIKDHLGGKKCEPSKMIKDVSYTDAGNQWLLAD